MRAPSKQVVKRDLHALAIGVTFGCVVLAGTFGIFIAAWGWAHFKVDFWPLDSSRIAPNLVASFVTVILVTAHNEARLVQKNAAHHVSLEQTLRDIIDSVVHPLETVEGSIADAVVERTEDQS